MPHRYHDFFLFIKTLFYYMNTVREVFFGLIALVILGGVLISQVEGKPISESIYFACITGLTIGYGDITPTTTLGRIISVAIGLIGIVFTGITVAVATRAFAEVTNVWKFERRISDAEHPDSSKK